MATALAIAVPILLAAGASPAAALSGGYMAIASSAASGVQDEHTGYGPGWIALTFDTSGAPHGPVTGYLFHDGVGGAVGNDHFDVSSYYTRPTADVYTPFAGGWAYGHFNGCHLVLPRTTTPGSCPTRGPTAPAGARRPATRPGSSATTRRPTRCATRARRVQSPRPASGRPAASTSRGPKTASSSAMSALRRSTPAGLRCPPNLVGYLPSSIVGVRYVTKRRDWVMATAYPGTGQLAYKLHWGFFPRSCLTPL